MVFYACGLTRSQENKSMRLIASLKHDMKPSARIVVWGCLPKQNPELLKKNFDGPMIGPSDMHAFEEILNKTMNIPKLSSTLEIPDVHIPIMQTLESDSSSFSLKYMTLCFMACDIL